MILDQIPKGKKRRDRERPLKPWLGFSTSHLTPCLDPVLVPDSPRRGHAGTHRNEQPSLGPQWEVLHPFGDPIINGEQRTLSLVSRCVCSATFATNGLGTAVYPNNFILQVRKLSEFPKLLPS